jgi:hypothetical protein
MLGTYNHVVVIAEECGEATLMSVHTTGIWNITSELEERVKQGDLDFFFVCVVLGFELRALLDRCSTTWS